MAESENGTINADRPELIRDYFEAGGAAAFALGEFSLSVLSSDNQLFDQVQIVEAECEMDLGYANEAHEVQAEFAPWNDRSLFVVLGDSSTPVLGVARMSSSNTDGVVKTLFDLDVIRGAAPGNSLVAIRSAGIGADLIDFSMLSIARKVSGLQRGKVLDALLGAGTIVSLYLRRVRPDCSFITFNSPEFGQILVDRSGYPFLPLPGNLGAKFKYALPWSPAEAPALAMHCPFESIAQAVITRQTTHLRRVSGWVERVDPTLIHTPRPPVSMWRSTNTARNEEQPPDRHRPDEGR